jgi:hypothetical protein
MEKQKTETKYLYEVVKSKSPEMPIGKKFWTNQKFTKIIGKEIELSDVKCRDYFIRLVEIKVKQKVHGIPPKPKVLGILPNFI